MLVDIDARVRTRVDRLVAEVGDIEFRHGVAKMTGYDTDVLSLDDVVCIYVLARHGRVHPSAAGQRAVAAFPSLPPRSLDDPCIDISRTVGPLAGSSRRLVSRPGSNTVRAQAVRMSDCT